jgi:antitoxin CptB
LSPEHKRLLWRSRRGMKELDVLLERFVRERYVAASESQKCAFAQLLELPDPVMADYLLGHAIPPEASWRELTRLITAPGL